MKTRLLRERRTSNLPVDFDPWAAVSYEDLPKALVEAFGNRHWDIVGEQLRQLMDGVTTDGPYGRQLVQLVRSLPLGVDPLFDRYRAVTAIDYGDWEDLQRCLELSPLEAVELEGIRDIWLAPITQRTAPAAVAEHQRALFNIHELQLNRDARRHRHFMQRMFGTRFADVTLRRPDMPTTRHLLYRRLQDAVILSAAESSGGRLPVALALAREGQRLGEKEEQLRIVAHDLELLIRHAMGQRDSSRLEWPLRLASRVGFTPLGAWETLSHLLPLIAAHGGELFEWSAASLERISLRMGSPRAELQACAWRVAAELSTGRGPDGTGLNALLVEAKLAFAGLRVLPQFLDGYARRRYSSFAEALELGRRTGNVWAQLSALSWMTAMNPTEWTSRYLLRLLEVTGWRRLVLVPPEIAGEAALGLMASGLRGGSIVELALSSGRPNVMVEVAARHLEDAHTPLAAQNVAVQALGRVGTTRAREILANLSHRKDQIGVAARAVLTKPASGTVLSEREVEVLQFAAKGMTNKEIGAQLCLSEHTIARHIANARSKLGASNRAEAVSRLSELARS